MASREASERSPAAGPPPDDVPFPLRRHAMAETIAGLDPRRDDALIARVLIACEFPFESRRAMELAILRTFGIPAIARVLVARGKFLSRPAKRIADTRVLLEGVVRYGHRSPTGQRFIARIRQAHRGLPTDTDEMRYVLGTFVFEPGRWVDRFGGRPVTRHEREAGHHFWRAVGAQLGVPAPEDIDDYEAFYDDFERRHMVFDPANRQLVETVREAYIAPLPRLLRPLGRHLMHGMLDDRLRTACGLPAAPAVVAKATASALRLRGALARRIARGWRPIEPPVPDPG